MVHLLDLIFAFFGDLIGSLFPDRAGKWLADVGGHAVLPRRAEEQGLSGLSPDGCLRTEGGSAGAVCGEEVGTEAESDPPG